MPKTKRNGKDVFDIAFEKALFDNAPSTLMTSYKTQN